MTESRPLVPSDLALTVVGRRARTLTAADLSTCAVTTYGEPFHCSSGREIAGRWVGVAVADLLDEADPAPNTTHLRLESRDGYRVCVPIRAALAGVLAFSRDDEPLDRPDGHGSRFVAPSVEGPRAVRDVARMEAVVLAPDEDPTDLETIGETDG